MRSFPAHSESGRSRQGILAPAIAMALLVVGSCLALVIDRAWVDTAHVELQTAAEAAALAGAATLADDHRLVGHLNYENLQATCYQRAAHVAAQNLVAGHPLILDHQDDIRIGRIEHVEGGKQFLETLDNPDHVVVFAERDRGKNNPVAGFLRPGAAEVTVTAEAGIDNAVVAITPRRGTAPALPLAILYDGSNVAYETWASAIVDIGGSDDYAYDRNTNDVLFVPDGLPEVHLISTPPGSSAQQSTNVVLTDLGAGLNSNAVQRQLRHGWTSADLSHFGGRLELNAFPQTIAGADQLSGVTLDALGHIVGEPRIVLLYENYQGQSVAGGTMQAVGLVAVRLMDFWPDAEGRLHLILQPAVLATRHVELADDSAAAVRHPFLYKLRLTY